MTDIAGNIFGQRRTPQARLGQFHGSISFPIQGSRMEIFPDSRSLNYIIYHIARRKTIDKINKIWLLNITHANPLTEVGCWHAWIPGISPK
jgi:hypothetical protein